MRVKQEVCGRCGYLNEYVCPSNLLAAITPRCKQCGSPLGEHHGGREDSYMGSLGSLQIRHVDGRGLGVFTTAPIPAKTIVERCPVHVLHKPSTEVMDTTLLPYAGTQEGIMLRWVAFPWISDENRALLLGYGMLYNHEPMGRANLSYEPYIHPKTQRRFVDFTSSRAIEAGEELTHTYATPDRLWFTHHPSGGSQ